MRIILSAAALATVFAMTTAMTAAKAETTVDPAGPTKQGSLCKFADSDEIYAYLAPCPQQAAVTKKMKRRKS